MSVLYRAIECFILAIFYGLAPFVIGGWIGWILRGEKMEKECSGCKYYDKEDSICSACECWPVMECDEKLPCENEGEDKND